MSLIEQLRGRSSRVVSRPPGCTCQYTATMGIANPGDCRVHSRPHCRFHASEMRPSRTPGVYYCTRKGGAQWCPERVSRDGEILAP